MIGSNNITTHKLGSSQVKKIYLGAELVWQDYVLNAVTENIATAVDLRNPNTVYIPNTSITDAVNDTVYPIVGSIDATADDTLHYEGLAASYVDVTATVDPLEGTPAASIDWWSKNDLAAQGAGEAGLFQISGYDSTNGTLWFYSNQSIYLDFFRDDRITVSTNSSGWMDGTEWNHYCVTSASGTGNWKFFVNGVRRHSSNGEAYVKVLNPRYSKKTLGFNTGGRDFGGELGKIIIYNRELTEAEVLANYDATKSRFLILN